jgi:hypothetical protein
MSLLKLLLCNPSISSEVVYTKVWCYRIKKSSQHSCIFCSVFCNTFRPLRNIFRLRHLNTQRVIYSCIIVINEMLIITIFEILVAVSGVWVKILIKKVAIKYSSLFVVVCCGRLEVARKSSLCLFYLKKFTVWNISDSDAHVYINVLCVLKLF